jgi:hypothetical protein
MITNKRTGKRGQPQLAYVCATHRARPGACSVRNGLLADDIHVRVVETLAREVFTPQRLRQAIADLAQQRAETESIDARRQEMKDERERVERELKQLVEAVAGGAGDVGTLVDAMRSRERTRAELDVQLGDLDARATEAKKFDLNEREADLRAVLDDWHAMLREDTGLGRRTLRDVLRSPIFVEREADGTWSFRLIGSFRGVIKRVYGIQVADADIEAMNAALEAELGADGHAFAYRAYTPLESGDRELLRLGSAAPGDHGDRRVQRHTCPGGIRSLLHRGSHGAGAGRVSPMAPTYSPCRAVNPTALPGITSDPNTERLPPSIVS